MRLKIFPILEFVGIGEDQETKTIHMVIRKTLAEGGEILSIKLKPEERAEDLRAHIDGNQTYIVVDDDLVIASYVDGEKLDLSPEVIAAVKVQYVGNQTDSVATPSSSTSETSTRGEDKAMGTNQTMAQADAKLTTVEHAKRDERFKDVTFERGGKQFQLPEDMTFAEAFKWLERKMKEEEVTVAIQEIVDAYVLDGAYAFARAMARTYGFNLAVPTPGMFGPTPPAMIGLEVGIDANGVAKTVQVPWGSVQVPGIDGRLETSFMKKDNRYLFVITGEVKQKHRGAVAALADLTREIARNESVYRNQAIRVRFPEPDEKFSPLMSPKFIDLSKVNEKELLFNDDVQDKIRTSVFNPIEKTELCRKFNIPLKTGVLLAGKFGTGKTMTANHAAKKCVRHGWTFIYLDTVRQLKEAILFAKQYQPAVIFAEDIDRVVRGERDEEMDAILNTIDGVDTKNSDIMVVLTTNELKKINQAMLRPGRLDSVIEVTPPDAKTAIRLIKLYGRGLINEKENLDKVGELLNGQIPASIQQVVEKSKRAALTHLEDGQNLVLHSKDLEVAAVTMLDHLKLLEEAPEDTRTDIEKMGAAIGEQLLSGIRYEAETNNESLQRLSKHTVGGRVVKTESAPS